VPHARRCDSRAFRIDSDISASRIKRCDIDVAARERGRNAVSLR